MLADLALTPPPIAILALLRVKVFQPQIDAEGGDIDDETKMHEDKGEKTCLQ